jgi:hypothetical protein
MINCHAALIIVTSAITMPCQLKVVQELMSSYVSISIDCVPHLCFKLVCLTPLFLGQFRFLDTETVNCQSMNNTGELFYHGAHAAVNYNEVVVLGMRQTNLADPSTRTFAVFRYNLDTDSIVWSKESTDIGKHTLIEESTMHSNNLEEVSKLPLYRHSLYLQYY